MVLQAREPVLDSNEAAEFLSLSVHTIHKHVQRGKLRPVRRVGTACLFLESELRRYKRERKPRGNPAFVKKK